MGTVRAHHDIERLPYLSHYTRRSVMADLSELEQPEIPEHAMVVRADAKAMGAVTALTHRASRDTWKAFGNGRVRGFASKSSDIDTVRVMNLNDPTVDYERDVSSFRKGGKGRAKVTESTRKVTEVERFGLVNDIGRDFS